MKRMRAFHAVIPIFFLVAMLALIMHMASAELSIDSDISWCDEKTSFNESIRIHSTGALHIVNSSVRFNCSFPLQYGITVEAGGLLEIADLDGDPGTGGDVSRIDGTDQYYIIAESGSVLILRNSVFLNCGATGIPYQSGLEVRCSDWTITGCSFSDSYCGIALQGTGGGTIVGCTFSGLDTGAAAVGDVNVTIANCSFTGMANGIWFHTTNGLVVSGCNFTQVRNYVMYLDSCSDITITGCHFKGCQSHGVYLKGAAGQALYSSSFAGTEIVMSVFDGVAYPIILNNFGAVTVSDCSFRMFTSALSMWALFANSIMFERNELTFGGIGVDYAVETCRDVVIRNNSFRNLTTAIKPLGENVLIEGNTIEDVTRAGIQQVGTGVTTVSRNTFVNCTFGIRIERDLTFNPGMILISNQFINNEYGLMARGVNSLSVSNNTWTGGRTAATLLDIDASGIAGETIAGYDVGYSLMGVRGTIREVTLRDCGRGILSDLGTKMTFYQCNLSRCGLDAIASNGSSLMLRDTPGARSFDVLDATSEIVVQWTVSVVLLFASTDLPAVGIPLVLVPSGHPQIGYYVTDGLGRVGPIVVPIGRATHGGTEWYNPYGVDVTYGQGGHVFRVAFEKDHLFVFRIDDIPPVVEMFEPRDGTILCVSTVQCRARVTDENGTVTRVTLFVDDQLLMDVTDFIDGRPFSIALSDGGHELLLVADDDWSNSCNFTSHVIIDTQPPEILISEPENGSVTNMLFVTVSGTIRGQSNASIGDKTITTDADGRFGINVEVPYEGPNVIWIFATDGAGNARNESVTVVRDTIAPMIKVDDVPALTNALELEISGTTDGDMVRCLLTNETSAGTGSFAFQVPVMEGTNEITLVAWDLAGNSARSTVTFLADQHVEFSVVEPPNGATVERPIVKVNITGELGLTISIAGPSISKTMNATRDVNISFDLGPLGPGLNRYTFNVTDEAGNTDSFVYFLNLLEPPLRVPEESPLWYPVLMVILVSFFVLASAWVWWRRRSR